MARVLKWKEKLALAFVTMFFSITGALPLGAHSAGAGDAYASQFVTGASGNTALGLELMARRPYVRLVRASLVPVSLPLAAGAYIALAGAPGSPGEPAPAAAAGDQCSSCNTTTARCCSLTDATCCDPNCGGGTCYMVTCCQTMSGVTYDCAQCTTCGNGSCHHVSLECN